ncbi:mannose-6-phosphate isomerase, class I [Yersinia enterocolitica]|uniref:mannose-6-phosphate isomerase, class I n=1 Tax=Yersinia enterocolitica TaxID=630 RepID=UPI0029ABF1CE|nr:mannose-6-phosphate isomerase, class I [Yersinia enterocolitica]EKN5946935.1 mannose-6-phosphate isomerase, class I [Yersinia enterocolitica]EKN5999145.1 mannose-6-phosphate isomerase, class I [Yersinia enterocolitica]ELW7381230.1 mannose-6-phosphate isomerase, class I [Yersinia enterocolitica]HDL7536343.1 mannose-6-phosphate isomerase, class I [Yersinia enterocolitica]
MSSKLSRCFYQLDNRVKNYAWGSRTALNQLFNIPNPDGQPQAELWMGVHPAGVSTINEQSQIKALSDVIAEDKCRILGTSTAERFGDLPFLLKILSAESALSIQVHPQKAQAETGFWQQQRQPHRAASPDYNDTNHKPELVYAITPFQAMNGFREVDQIIAHFKILDIPAITAALDALITQPNADGLKLFFVTLMQLTPELCQQVVRQLVSQASACFSPELATLIHNLNQSYPDDIGVFAPLLLNCITLAPGEAMFLQPGTLHAYVKGTAIEVMASSDNVLRAGLTSKKINLSELVLCTTFTSIKPNDLLLRPSQTQECFNYSVPVDDFRFCIFSNVESRAITADSAEIILVISGVATLHHASGEALILNAGQSAFIPAFVGQFTLTCSGKVCRVYC